MFTIIDATRLPRNPHLGHRIHGDALLFKVNQLQVHAGDKQPNLQHVIYEDVAGDLLTSPLLKEMTQAMEWKVFSPYNVVQVGRVRAQMREREMIEQREKEQRLSAQSEPARDSQLMQMDGAAEESQQRETTRQRGRRRQNKSKEEKEKEREDTMRQQQRMVEMKNEQMKNDTRAWEQKNAEKRRESGDQEGREYEIGEQQHASSSFTQTGPSSSSKPSPKKRQARTPKSTPSRVSKPTLKSSVKKTPSSKSKGKKSAPHKNITMESVQKHLAEVDNGGPSHDVPEASSSGAESRGVVPMEGTVSGNDPFAVSSDDPFAVSSNDPFAVSSNDPFAVSSNDPLTVSGSYPFTLSDNNPPAPSFEQLFGYKPEDDPLFRELAARQMEVPTTSDGTAEAAFVEESRPGWEDFRDGGYGELLDFLPGFGNGDDLFLG